MKYIILGCFFCYFPVFTYAGEEQYLPYTFKAGDLVVLSLNQQGMEKINNSKQFCSGFKSAPQTLLDDFNQRSQMKHRSKHLDLSCYTAVKSVSDSLRFIGFSGCMTHTGRKAMCDDFINNFNLISPQLDFFRTHYLEAENKKQQHNLDVIQNNNADLIDSMKKQKEEDLAFCDSNFDNVKKNDLTGISTTTELIDYKADLDQLKNMINYKYITPTIKKVCLKQKRYSDIYQDVKITQEKLNTAISNIEAKNKKSEINVRKLLDKHSETEKTYYSNQSQTTNTFSLIESGATIEKSFSSDAIEAAVNIVRFNGYSCSTVSSIQTMIFKRGFTIRCNNFNYTYDVFDKGGNWVVSVE
ncbi:hypothetical protein LDJ79_05865 [Vibrio tritonius]|uniref:Uncharacterized protein n=1 Tax=Vibrio tritonius TaxID=1435069 RepID=A0ABS7YJT5_9VIBR|nr:hypothetical protein [Vibrio tritonius]MCA2015628.1 hypothetical protein [Vibrio tritonius]